MPFLRFLAKRICPVCRRVLEQHEHGEPVKCICGWIWK
jgi:hypothetical protein